MLFKKAKTHDEETDALKIINDSTPFAITESFRSLCTNVLYLPIEDKCKKIAVTSAVAGEGKTYISINLAITLAQSLDDKKVLLVDMDMRKPSVSKLFNNFDSSYSNARGLSEFLVGLDEKVNIVPTKVPNLSILFSGAKNLNPAGLINSSKMAELIAECEETYDYIIIDTPPVNIVSDATLLSSRINGYILATRADYSNVKALSDAIDVLNIVDAQIFGVVLSGVQPKKSSKHGYNYYNNGYYGYGYGK